MALHDFVLPYHVEVYRGFKTGSDTEILGWRLNIVNAEGFIISNLTINKPDYPHSPAYYYPTREEALAAWNKPRIFEAVTSIDQEVIDKWQSDFEEWVRHPDVERPVTVLGSEG